MKTSELTGAALDWAVCRCEGLRYIGNYAKSWRHCGPIKEKYQISTTYCSGHVEATFKGYYGQGPTELIAAMRCYVASKLGDTVDVPEGLG